jgi:hypothetical protein
MAIKTIRVFAEYTSDGYVPMPSQGNIDYGITIGNSFPETQPSSYQTDDPNIDVAVNTMTDFYVWIRTHGSPWNPSYTRVVRVYPDSPSINSVVMNMIVAVGSGGTSINAGGGVTYYLNGGTSQGILDGSTYYEMSKTPVEGTMVDFFKINTTGFENIAQFVTDAGDPSLLKIPPGAWPLGFYFSASDNSGSPSFYAEIYKYADTGVFTLLGSSVASPQIISNGVAIDYYTTTVTIPDTTLLITDRIAIRIFVDTDGNRTVNFHTQDSHLATVGTTFANGLTAINGLTKQVQFINIGNAGSDAAVVSSDDTHTINLPTASATKRGLLNSTDWSTFNAKQAALSGTGFVKIDGSTISYDNSTYQPLDGDLTAIGALAGTTGILKKTGSNTWELDTTTYLSTGVAASTYQRLDKMVSNLLASDTEYPNSNAVLAALALKANALNPEFTGSMTVGGAYPKIYLTDSDNNPDYFIGNDDGYFRIYDQTNTVSRFYITNLGVSTFPGSVIVGSIAKSGGLSTEFLKADGTVDSNTYATSGSLSNYLLSTTAASTYQRLDKMVSNLLASDTEYPNSNAVLAKLALKADAASPTFTGNMTISSASPKLYLTDTDNNPDYFIGNDDGYFRIYDQTNTVSRFYITSLGVSTFPGDVIVGKITKSGGTASQFLKADGSVDSSTYALNSALANYLLISTAGTTYQTLANLSADLTASTTKYPSVTAVNTGLATKQPLDADLTAIAALAGTSGYLKKTAANTWTLDTSTFLVASDLSTYLTSATAASTYQRLDKMVSNLLASSTEYPNSNAVIAALALKANAANPTFTGDFTISGTTPRLYFVDTDNNPDYTLFTDSGYFYIYDQTAGATKFQITPSGNAINTGTLTSASFIKSGGTSSQFLMADGSVSTGVANQVTGTGTTNYLPKFTGASTIGNSLIQDNGTTVTIGAGAGASNIVNINSDTSILRISGLGFSANRNYGSLEFYNTDGSQAGPNVAAAIRANSVQSDGSGGILTFHTSLGTESEGTSAAEKMRLDGSGNLGLGVTPSAWIGVYRSVQIGSGASISGRTDNATWSELLANAYRATDGTWKYLSSNLASSYQQSSGSHFWFTAPSGTAGNAISFTQAMTLTASGRLLLGTTAEATYLLDVNGTGRFSGNVNFIGESVLNGNNWYLMTTATNPNLAINYNGKTTASLIFYSGTSERFKVTSTGAATFSSSVTANNAVFNGVSTINLKVQNAATANTSVLIQSYGSEVAGENASILFKSAANNTDTNYAKGLVSFVNNGTGYGRGSLIFAVNNSASGTQVSASDAKLTIASTGAATFSSSVTATSFFESSDLRLKTLIKHNPIMEGIEDLQAKLYEKNGKTELGYFAQDAEKYMPFAVSIGTDGFFTLSYREIHTAKISRLEKRVAELEKQLNLN